jgi:hypothetical protein
MKLIRLVPGLLLAPAVLVAPEASAFDVPAADGGPCYFTGAAASEGVQSGNLGGGPVYGRSETRPVTGVYLICTVQVGVQNIAHAGADAASTAVWEMAVAVLTPQQVTFPRQPGEPLFVCTETWIDTNKGHVTLFFNASNGQWSMDNSVPCQQFV